jgi:hypothetical protein
MASLSFHFPSLSYSSILPLHIFEHLLDQETSEGWDVHVELQVLGWDYPQISFTYIHPYIFPRSLLPILGDAKIKVSASSPLSWEGWSPRRVAHQILVVSSR